MSVQIPFSFIHCADLHLDSPFSGIQSLEPEIAQSLLEASFNAFEKVIDKAIAARCDFILIAGDIYDSPTHSLRAQLRFIKALERAAANGISCYIAYGNYDPLSAWDAKPKFPENVHRFSAEIEMSPYFKGDERAAHIYGISHDSDSVTRNLAKNFHKTETEPFAIGLLHANVGRNPKHLNCAPCTINDLKAAKMDYWALGHVHDHEVLKEHAPTIIYSGSIQGRNAQESGAHGCMLVNVDENSQTKFQFIPCDNVRWYNTIVDISNCLSLDDIQETLYSRREAARQEADGCAALLKIQLSGQGPAYSMLMDADLEKEIANPLRDGESERADYAWIASLDLVPLPAPDISARSTVEDIVGEYLRQAQALSSADNTVELIWQIIESHPEHSAIAAQLRRFSDAELLAMFTSGVNSGLEMLLQQGR